MLPPHREQEIDSETTRCLEILDLILPRRQIKRLLLKVLSPDLASSQIEFHPTYPGSSCQELVVKAVGVVSADDVRILLLNVVLERFNHIRFRLVSPELHRRIIRLVNTRPHKHLAGDRFCHSIGPPGRDPDLNDRIFLRDRELAALRHTLNIVGRYFQGSICAHLTTNIHKIYIPRLFHSLDFRPRHECDRRRRKNLVIVVEAEKWRKISFIDSVDWLSVLSGILRNFGSRTEILHRFHLHLLDLRRLKIIEPRKYIILLHVSHSDLGDSVILCSKIIFGCHVEVRFVSTNTDHCGRPFIGSTVNINNVFLFVIIVVDPVTGTKN